MKKLKIVRVAILKNDVVFVGLEKERHHHILNKMRGYLVGEGYNGLQPIQGFITSEGDFVNRKDAAKIAYKAGQTKELLIELFSEDLW